MNFYLAQKFNVMKYIQPDENRLSDIIADLLNPKGDHGQGTLFLAEFLKIVLKKEWNSEELEDFLQGKVKVAREKTTNLISQQNRRMDVLVEFTQPKFSLGIENKPWAGEQQNQVQDYVSFLQALSGDDFIFVYLSGKDGPPTSISKECYDRLSKSGRLLILSYSNGFCEWLKSCRAVCQAEKVRLFLQDLIDYVKSNSLFSIEMKPR